MFRFLHAADLHMDSPLKGLSQFNPELAEKIRKASRLALDNLIRVAKEQKVAFVVIAGDILDGGVRDQGTIQFLLSRLGELAQSIPVYLIRGNHDAVNNLGANLIWPKNVHQFGGDKAGTVIVHGLPVAIHGQSFASQATTENLAAAYPEPVAGHFNIGILHTSLAGREGHDTYAPVTPEQLKSKRYDYWALGHIHKREMVREGDPWIVFPGNIQGRSIRETGPRGCAIVTVEGSLQARAEFVDLDVVRFHEVEVDLSGMELLEELTERVREAAQQVIRSGSISVARVRLVGITKHAGNLAANRDLIGDVRQTLSGLGISLEKLKIECREPEARSEGADAAEEMFGAVAQEWQSNHDALKRILDGDTEFQSLGKKLGNVLSEEEIKDLLNPEEVLPALEQHLKTLSAKTWV
jgi:DNA repair exonuclease SbcCD nuclease subunit